MTFFRKGNLFTNKILGEKNLKTFSNDRLPNKENNVLHYVTSNINDKMKSTKTVITASNMSFIARYFTPNSCLIQHSTSHCLVKDMIVYFLILLLHSSASVPIQMTGELDIQLVQNKVDFEFRGKKKADSLLLKLDHTNAITATPECIYQYPKRKQVDAMLSNMMNELTKIFVRVREYLELENAKIAKNEVVTPTEETSEAEGDTDVAGDTKELEKMRALRPQQRPRGSRFRVVSGSGRPQRYFDEIYSNMTQEYKNFYHERSGSMLLRTGPDPCSHQEEVKQLWLDLLDNAQDSLRRASLRCVRRYLRAGGPRSHDERVKSKVGMFLLKEFKKLRSLQLDTLCDQFKLCYKDLL